MSTITDIDAGRIGPKIIQAIELFLSDPPDDDFQRGYLACLITLYTEAIGRGHTDARIAAAERLLRATAPE